MRKIKCIIAGVLAIAVASCSTMPKPLPPSTTLYAFDYSQVSKDYGVGFTEADAVAFEYDAVASVNFYEWGGYVPKVEYKKQRKEQGKTQDGIYYEKEIKEVPKYVYCDPDPQKGLANLAQEVRNMGGNYVLNLEIEKGYSVVDGLMYSYFRYTGMVVKKK